MMKVYDCHDIMVWSALSEHNRYDLTIVVNFPQYFFYISLVSCCSYEYILLSYFISVLVHYSRSVLQILHLFMYSPATCYLPILLNGVWID